MRKKGHHPLKKTKIAFFDIDGTILKPDHTYDPSVIDAFTALREAGVHLALATGRPIHEIEDLIEELEIDTVIGYNGTLALHQGEVIFKRPFAKELVAELIDHYKALDCEFAMYTHGTSVFSHLKDAAVQQFIDTFQMKLNDEWYEGKEMDVFGATYIKAPQNLADQIQHEAIRIAPVNVQGLNDCYDIILHKENKGIAVREVCRHFGYDVKEAIAFGDGLNDAEMLETVGTGVAMGNATEALLPYADIQTTRVDEDGIYQGLKQLNLI